MRDNIKTNSKLLENKVDALGQDLENKINSVDKTFNNNKSEHLTITIPTRSCQHCHTVEKLGHLAWNIRTPIRTRFDFLPHEINSRKENIQTWN